MNNRIHRLPDDLVNKIAAGEVVERPSSVVKELFENALDAGARTVAVEIEGGGRSLIRVRDDGTGMSREDAELAIERHATSKLLALEDLQRVETHGFRGEALPSIASVSHLVLRTREDSGPVGTEVEVRHGRLVHVRDAGHPRGTTIEVRDLFGAVPARRKFLRTDATEAAHVSEAVTMLALARPDVGVSLTSGGRSTIDAPAVDGLAARLYQLFGGRSLEDLVPVEGVEGWAQVRGLVSRAERAAGSRGVLRLFVNGRPVRDRAISKAVIEAYRAAGVRDPRPEAFLFLQAPPSLVDVNVHPAKTEVRFADGRIVWNAVEHSVRDALSAGSREPAPAPIARVEEAAERYLVSHPHAGTPAGPRMLPSGPRGAATAGAPELFEAAAPTVLGQHRNTYIVASDGDDILLVDQHTAQERVLFERIQARRAERNVESQMLLSPLVVDLGPEIAPLLEEHVSLIGALGFDAEPFGGGSVRLRAVPALLGSGDPGRMLQGILRDVVERDAAEWAVSGTGDRLAATLACHASVRAGEPLRLEAMSAIVRDLFGAAHPGLCPHGRPTSVRIPREDVARWFGRAGWRRQ